jgi:predicted ATPase/DNA-binding SARP family transcriptional activator
VGESLRVAVLGPFEVRDDGEVVTLSGTKQRAVVALLATDAGRVVSADRLIDAIWGDDAPVDATNALQHHVSRLRRALGADHLVARPPGYVLELDGNAVDAIAFEGLAAEGRAALRAGDAERAASKLREALSLWRGEPFTEFADQSWSVSEAARLERLHEDALEDRLEADLALGRHAEVGTELEAIVEEHPFRERMWGQLMLALYRSGRQADALDAYRRAREALADQYGLDPGPELQQLEARILSQDPSLASPASTAAATTAAHAAPERSVRGNLPAPLTTFVGRQDELRDVGRLLDDNRLVSLLGPGGAGKTRLAVELGRRIAEDHGDGVWLVELGRVTHDDDVAAAVLSVLEGRETGRTAGLGPAGTTGSAIDGIHEHLGGRDAVLVFDNCEHVLDAGAELARSILERHEAVRILATSREPLGVPGEVRWPVAPLRVPPRAVGDARDLLGSEAVRLFVDRATAANPSFELTQDNAPAVAELCRRLDGLPLALELAAARVSALPVAAIADALQDRFRLLTAGGRSAPLRQQTLRAAIDWSYELLEEPERSLFRGCSVFPAGFSIEAAAWVGERNGLSTANVLAVLTALVDKSMLVTGVGPAGEPRYSMLETLRSYGNELIAELGEEAAAGRALSEYVLRLVELGDEGLRGREHLRWLHLLDVEFDNVRAGFDEAIRALDAETAIRIAAALGWYFAITDRHRHGDGRAWMEEALSLPYENLAPDVRTHALAILAYLAGQELDVDAAIAVGQEAVAFGEKAGRTRPFALACTVLGMALGAAGVGERARDLVRTGSEIYRDIGDEWGIGSAELILAPLDIRMGDLEAVSHRGRAAVESGRRSGYDPWEIWGRLLLAWADERTGSIRAARDEYERALALSTALGFEHYVSFVLVGLGRLALADGDEDGGLDLLRRAVESADSAESTWFAGLAHQALGVALDRLGRREAAEGELLRVVETVEDLRRPSPRETFFAVLAGDPVARALVALAESAERRGDVEEAARSARAGLERAEREQDAPTVAAALAVLARLPAA